MANGDNDHLCSFRITGVNMKATGQTTIVAAKTGKYFEPTQLIVRRTAYSGAGTETVFNVGNDSGASYSNIFATRSIAGYGLDMMAFLKPDNVVDSGGLAIDIGTNAIKVNITTASTRTTETASFILQGFLV